jgi:hypothetical protein
MMGNTTMHGAIPLLQLTVIALALVPAKGNGADDATNGLSFSATSGMTYSSGKYGTDEKTDILAVPLIVKVQNGRISASLAIPYIRTNGSATIRDSGTIFTKSRRTVEGWGDLTGTLGYDLYVNNERLETLSLSGKIKFPTGARTKGLGNGEYDYALQMDGIKGVGKVALLGTLGYKIFGDAPDALLRNVFYGSVGAAYRLAPSHNIGITYDARESIRAGAAAAGDVTLFYSLKTSRTSQVLLFVGKGFSNASQDYGGGLMVVYRY